jgi:hypothetical protein
MTASDVEPNMDPTPILDPSVETGEDLCFFDGRDGSAEACALGVKPTDAKTATLGTEPTCTKTTALGGKPNVPSTNECFNETTTSDVEPNMDPTPILDPIVETGEDLCFLDA